MRVKAIALLAIAVVLSGLAAGTSDWVFAGGLKVFLDSTIELDEAAGTITLPLFRGTHEGDDVFYIITESSDRDDAEALGVNWAPKLAIGTAAVQEVEVLDGVVEFEGTVDFSPERVVVPGPEGFPPEQAEPGSVGDAQL